MMSDPTARILVVDDEVANMRALCDTLSDQGYETVGCASGEEALDALRAGSFDVLLTDLMMPGMDGVELLEKGLRIDPHLVGVLMTGQGTITTAVQAMQVGALDYVLKPLKVSVLLPVLSRAVEVRSLRLENLELRDTVAIQELNQAIAHTLDAKELLEKVADAALSQFEADEASVMLLSESGQSLRVEAVRGGSREMLLGKQVPFGKSVAGHVAAKGEPLVAHGEIREGEVRSEYPRAGIQTSLSMPMMTRGKLVGVLNVNYTRQAKNIPPGQVKVFGIFTNAAAAGIEAARLYEEERRARTRYAEVLNAAADGVISVGEDQRIIIFNRGAEHIFGYKAEEVVGQPLRMLVPQWVGGAHSGHVSAFMAGPDASRAMGGGEQLMVSRKDGTSVSIEVGISRHTEQGEAIATAIVRDVTQRVTLENQLRQAQKMEAVGQLTGGIAHDFNNVLTVIISNAEVLELGLPEDTGHREDLGELLAAAKRGANMISRLMKFSRRGMLSIQPVSLGAILADVAPMVTRLLPASIRFEVNDTTDPSLAVLADRGSIEQMVLNLCTNARDAMLEGGSLCVACEATRLDEGYHATHPWVVPGSYVSVAVTDTGIGMDEETQRRMFEPFFSTKDADKGTGLGMAMVYGLMKQHNGMAHVYSEVGQGTTIKLYFPVAADEEPRSIRAGPDDSAVASTEGIETILLAEDDRAIRRATKRALEGKGYRVLTAADGEEALEIIGHDGAEIALVISDLVMPKLGGRQLVEALRASGSQVPVLFTSGHSSETATEAGLPTGVEFLQKPWTLDDLFVQVRRSLEHHR